jgi:ribosome-binding factor A
MRTRTTPRLEFHYDPSLEKSVRINRILNDLARERAEKEGDDSEEEGATGD